MRSAGSVIAALVVMSVVFAGCSHFTGKTAGESLNDTVIVSDIKSQIVRDPEMKTFAIDVNSYQGNVTLSGLAPDKAAEERLIEYARSTKGVKSVRTNMQLASAAHEHPAPASAATAPMASTGTEKGEPGASSETAPMASPDTDRTQSEEGATETSSH